MDGVPHRLPCCEKHISCVVCSRLLSPLATAARGERARRPAMKNHRMLWSGDGGEQRRARREGGVPECAGWDLGANVT